MYINKFKFDIMYTNTLYIINNYKRVVLNIYSCQKIKKKIIQ